MCHVYQILRDGRAAVLRGVLQGGHVSQLPRVRAHRGWGRRQDRRQGRPRGHGEDLPHPVCQVRCTFNGTITFYDIFVCCWNGVTCVVQIFLCTDKIFCCCISCYRCTVCDEVIHGKIITVDGKFVCGKCGEQVSRSRVMNIY